MAAIACGSTPLGSSRCPAAKTGFTWATSTGASSPRRLPSSAIQVITGSSLTKTPSNSNHVLFSKTSVTAITGSQVRSVFGRFSPGSIRAAWGCGMHSAARVASMVAGTQTTGLDREFLDVGFGFDFAQPLREVLDHRSKTTRCCVTHRSGANTTHGAFVVNVERVRPWTHDSLFDHGLDDGDEVRVASSEITRAVIHYTTVERGPSVPQPSRCHATADGTSSIHHLDFRARLLRRYSRRNTRQACADDKEIGGGHESRGSNRGIAVVEQCIDAFDLVLLAYRISGSSKSNKATQESLIRLMVPRHRTMAFPAVAAKRVQSAVITHTRERV